MALLTRLAKVAYRRSAADAMTMSLRNYVMLTYVRDHGRVPQQTLAEAMSMDANNVVILLNGLEETGLARRVRDPADRRRHVVELTELGARERDQAEEDLESVEDSVFAALSQEERATMHTLLAKALAGADDPAAPQREAAARDRSAATSA